jgi:hypothetical protein
MNSLEEMHTRHLAEAREQLEGQLGTVYKPSSKLLDNRRVFDQLVRQKKYAEAHDLKAEIEHMELVEQQRHMELREAKIMKGMEKVIAKQVIERNSLKKRLDYQQYEQIRLREAETIQYALHIFPC